MNKATSSNWKVAKVQDVIYPVSYWRSVGGKTERCADPLWIFMEDHGSLGARTFEFDRDGHFIGDGDAQSESEAASTIANNYLLDPRGWIDIPSELVTGSGWIESSWLTFACEAFER